MVCFYRGSMEIPRLPPEAAAKAHLPGPPQARLYRGSGGKFPPG